MTKETLESLQIDAKYQLLQKNILAFELGKITQIELINLSRAMDGEDPV